MKKFISTAAMVILALTVMAQHQWKAGRSGQYEYRYVNGDPMHARFYTLANGLTVILSPNHREPRVTMRIAVRTGSNNDPEDHTGLAHYLEHLLFKGTDRYGTMDWAKEKPYLDTITNLYEAYDASTDSAERAAIYRHIDQVSLRASHYSISNEYEKMMTSIGSKGTNAHTATDETVFEEDVPSNALDVLMTIEAERYRHPVFRLFHTELEAVYEEKNRTLDNDNSKIHQAMMAALYPESHYGTQTTIGTVHDLRRPSLKAIQAYYDKYYVPNNMAVIVSGDFDPDTTIAMIDRHFSGMKPHSFNSYVNPQEPALTSAEVVKVYGPTSPEVSMGWRVAAVDTHEALVADIMGDILSNSKAGLLDVDLNQQQKVLGAGAGVMQYKDLGVFLVAAAPGPGQTLEQAHDLLLDEVHKLEDGKFDKSLLNAIVANRKLAEQTSLPDNKFRANSLVRSFINSRGQDWEDQVNRDEQMAAVTRADIIKYAHEIFDKGFVIAYKFQGIDSSIEKVEKPPITPVETNPHSTSKFVKYITSIKLTPVQPRWIKFDTAITNSAEGIAKLKFVPNRENKVFSVTYHLNAGSRNNYLLPLAADYLDYIGTKDKTAAELAREWFGLACNYSIDVSGKETDITVSGLAENFSKAVALLEDMLHHCKADTAALTALKRRLLQTRKNNLADKREITTALIYYARYGRLNPYNDVLNNEALRAVKPDTLIELLHGLTHWRHTILCYGPWKLAEVKSVLGKYHHLPKAWTKAPARRVYAYAIQDQPRVLFMDYNQVQAEAYWVRNLSYYNPKMQATVNFFNEYFGGGMGSVVFRTIRESQALAYSTYAYVSTPNDDKSEFCFIGYVGCQADKLNQSVHAMESLLDTMPEVNQGMDDARKELITGEQTSRVTGDGILSYWLDAQRKGIDYDLRKVNYGAYHTLSMPDLKLYHDEKLSGKPYTICIIGPAAGIPDEELKQYGQLQKMKVSDLFGY